MKAIRAKQLVAAVAVTVLAWSAAVAAHHSYAGFRRDGPITIEGTLETLEFVNPHILFRVRTADATSHLFVWEAVGSITRYGVTSTTLKVGDRLQITGAPAVDPTEHVISLLREIRRPADGWSWQRSVRASSAPLG